MENAAEQAQQAQGWAPWRPSIWVRARYWRINMTTFEAGSAVLGQKEGKKENCLIIYPEGTSLPRRPKRIIMAYRLCLRLCSRYIGLLLRRHEANTWYGFYSRIRAVISARFYSIAKLRYADF